MNEEMNNIRWSENVIIADGDYADRVAFDLIVNYERMIGRRIPQADLAQWLGCLALDGGVRPKEGQEVQVVLVHSKEHRRMENFVPSAYDEEIDGQAFRDEQLGEFLLSATAVEELLVSRDDLFLDIVGTVLARNEVKRVMIVPDADTGTLYDDLRETIRRHDETEKSVTVFTMEPRQGGRFQQEMLGYSLTAALGVRADELTVKT